MRCNGDFQSGKSNRNSGFYDGHRLRCPLPDHPGTDPSFALIGLIYSITPDLDVDLGFKAGLSGTETDATLLTGLTMRF